MSCEPPSLEKNLLEIPSFELGGGVIHIAEDITNLTWAGDLPSLQEKFGKRLPTMAVL